MTLNFDIACRSIKGARPYQEDAAAFWPGGATYTSQVATELPAAAPDRRVLVLADGMGGHAGGAMASMSVCETFMASMAGVLEGTEDVDDDETPTVPVSGAAPSANTVAFDAIREQRSRMAAALSACNVAIIAAVDMQPSLAGMGTTLIGAEVTPAGLMWISVGDSPLYLCRRGEIAQLNEDHSLAPMLEEMVASGKLSAEAARNDPRRHMLRSAINGETLDLVDLPKQPLVLAPGDTVVLASDGIQTLEPEEIARIIAGYGNDGATAVADALLRGVEQQRAPHQDNATVIVMRVLS